jgi:hypothetical protein
MGQSARNVNERIRTLMCWSNARTRAHLTLLAIYFGLVDISTMPFDRTEVGASTSRLSAAWSTRRRGPSVGAAVAAAL